MKVLCAHCLEKEEYTTKQKLVTKTLKGVTVKYWETVAFCKNCENEIYVQKIEEQNLEAYQDAYCRAINIAELSVIRALPIKYNIGIRPLSKMLGWGEITYTRYFEGFMPTKQYSEEIIKLSNNPEYFLEKLNSGKNKLTSCAYKKAAEAALLLIKANRHENTMNAKQDEYVTSISYGCKYQFLSQAA